MTKEEFKNLIDEELRDAEGLLIGLLPQTFSEEQRKKIAQLCMPIVGIVVTKVIARLKKQREKPWQL